MGRAVGIHVKRAAVQLGRSSVPALDRSDAEYAAKAAYVRFFVHNVFLPPLRHKVMWTLPPPIMPAVMHLPLPQCRRIANRIQSLKCRQRPLCYQIVGKGC